MTRQEIADLLELVIANYPETFIKDAKAMVSVWEMAFGEYPADKIYRAARFHMDVSKKFPTIADIKGCLNKGEMKYGENGLALTAPKEEALIAPVAPKKKIDAYCKGAEACPYFEMDICFGTKAEWDNCSL